MELLVLLDLKDQHLPYLDRQEQLVLRDLPDRKEQLEQREQPELLALLGHKDLLVQLEQLVQHQQFLDQLVLPDPMAVTH